MPTYRRGDKGKYQLIVSDKAWQGLQQRLKSVTRKTSPITFDERIAKINEIQRGWLNYFRGASLYGKLKDMDGWLRNRNDLKAKNLFKSFKPKSSYMSAVFNVLA